MRFASGSTQARFGAIAMSGWVGLVPAIVD